MIEPDIILNSRSGLIYRRRVGQQDAKLTVIMLHGLGGDENSMWVLEHVLPRSAAIIAPRALFQIGERSFSWVGDTVKGWPNKEDFQPAIDALKQLILELETDLGIDQEQLVLMGFSQGAAVAFSAAADPSISPKAIIAAATFLPVGDYDNLRGVPIFWGHGSKDEWISIERARNGYQRLRQLGAKIHFCETDVGHKIGVECLNGLNGWLERID